MPDIPSNTQAPTQAFAAAFETAKRDDGTSFVRLKDGSPDWMTDVCREAHGGMLPDDMRYKMIREVVDIMTETEDEDEQREALDGLVDVSYYNLAQWLASGTSRFGYCDEAAEEFGPPKSTDQLLQWGQLREYEEILSQLRSALDGVEVAE